GERFAQRVRDQAIRVSGSKRGPGGERVYAPGELVWATRQASGGVYRLDLRTLGSLIKTATRVGLPNFQEWLLETRGASTMRAHLDAEGDVIVVTGGANGIGLALARAAAQAGARVVVCDVDAAAMAALSGVAGIATRRLDVSDRAAVFDVLGEVERDFGKID